MASTGGDVPLEVGEWHLVDGIAEFGDPTDARFPPPRRHPNGWAGLLPLRWL